MYTVTIVPTKSDSHVIFVYNYRVYSILPPNALRRDFNGKCIELIEGHALEVVVEVYNATHEILTCVLHVRRYCTVVVMSTAFDAGVPGLNLFRGCFFFLHIFTRPKRNRRHYFKLL